MVFTIKCVLYFIFTILLFSLRYSTTVLNYDPSSGILGTSSAFSSKETIDVFAGSFDGYLINYLYSRSGMTAVKFFFLDEGVVVFFSFSSFAFVGCRS